MSLHKVFILSAQRTPIGKFNGVLKSKSAVELGVIALKAAVEKASIGDKSKIEEVYFGQVLQGNIGQAPARQVVIKSGLPETTEATTINKVCSSGLKSVILASQSLRLGDRSLMIAGGMESMSNAPFYLQRNLLFGHSKLQDAIIKDGLWDPYNDIHMGSCAENTRKEYSITREEQDAYAIESYKRAHKALEIGAFAEEIVPIEIKSRKGSTTIDQDEQAGSLKLDKIPTLKPAFEKDGTVTAANSSPLNDGAAALVLANDSFSGGADPIAEVVAYADAARAPIDFTIAPSLAIPLALKKAGLDIQDVAKFEVNEAFAAVSLANQKILGYDPAKVNVNGGAIALGHAIGSSGARILVTLLHTLKKGEYGVAALCNGGGGSSAVVVKKL